MRHKNQFIPRYIDVKLHIMKYQLPTRGKQGNGRIGRLKSSKKLENNEMIPGLKTKSTTFRPLPKELTKVNPERRNRMQKTIEGANTINVKQILTVWNIEE